MARESSPATGMRGKARSSDSVSEGTSEALAPDLPVLLGRSLVLVGLPLESLVAEAETLVAKVSVG